jgi:hypothetical protein
VGRRSGDPAAEPETRAYLLEEARDFLHLMCSTLLEDGPESAQYAYDQLSGRVEAIEAGRAVWLHRYELPDGHLMGAPHGGHPCDSLELDERDVLRQPRVQSSRL